MNSQTKPRLIAYYLPQFHPIQENDEWWGKGFTEWTNVAKAKPLFKGHYQPHIPADLGFYDLRVEEVREEQALLAKEAGVEGFCYWYLWSEGKRLLERPLNEMISSGKPDLPFCLGWDNETWTGVWHNAPDRILREQVYPGSEDNIQHFNSVMLPAFSDSRYIKIDGSPLLVVFRPADLPQGTPEHFRSMTIDAGFPGLFMLGVAKDEREAMVIKQNGFNGFTISRTNGRGKKLPWFRQVMLNIFGEKKASSLFRKYFKKPFHVFESKYLLPYIDADKNLPIEFFPAVMPNWDNTPRAGLFGHVFNNPSPELFKEHLHQAIERVSDYAPEHKIIIVKSWNEWAEGNYLEPDLKYGHSFLDAIQTELAQHRERNT